MREVNIEHRTSNIEHRTSNIEHPTLNIEVEENEKFASSCGWIILIQTVLGASRSMF